MADPTFCTIEDLQGYEPNILDLAEKGHFNVELAAARLEIQDRLLISRVIENLDMLGANIQPRQLRTPAIFLTLEMIFTTNSNDDESPYTKKANYYGDKFDSVFNNITVLDLDTDGDGTLEDNEQNAVNTNFGRLRRR